MSEPRPPIRIVIADDHPLVRDGLRKLLEGQSGFRVIGEAADGIEALERAKALEPDVLLLDLAMPRMNGLEVLSALADSTTSVRTVLLTAAIEGEETVRALRLGARGVVLKESATEQLYLCIRAVMRGEFWVGREHVGDLLQALRQLERASSPPPPAATLTARERQIIAAVVEGASNRDIGKMIGVSEQTVKNRLSSVFDKLGVSSRLELALYAVHHGLLADGEQSAGTPPRTS
jgi:DNA-binding NarL/FixJ family response regulator